MTADSQEGDVGQEALEDNAGQRSCRRWIARILRKTACLLMMALVIGAAYIILTNCRGQLAKRRVIRELESRGLPAVPTRPANQDRDASQHPDVSLAEEANDGSRLYLAAWEVARFPITWRDDLPRAGWSSEPELCTRIDDNLVAVLEEYVQIQKPLYSLVEKARSCERFDYDIDFALGEAHFARAIGGIQKTARAMCVLSLHEQSIGDTEKAIDACAAILDMKSSVPYARESLPWLLRVDVGTKAIRGVEHAVSRGVASPDCLLEFRSRVLAELLEFDHKSVMAAGIAMDVRYLYHPGLWTAARELGVERACLRGDRRDLMCALHFLNPKHHSYSSRLGEPIQIRSSDRLRARLVLNWYRLWHLVCPGWWRLCFARDIEANLETYDAIDIRSQVTQGSDRSRVLGTILEYQASLKVCAVALALETYRIDHGRWPDPFSQLALEENSLRDPFSAGLLKYEFTDSGCVVYSIGRNQKDDKGETNTLGKDDLAFHLFDPQERNQAHATSSD